EAPQQFLPEVLPGCGKMSLQFHQHVRIDDFAGFHVNKALLYLFKLLASGIIGKALDHAMTASCYHGGIQCMMSITVASHLDQTPTPAKKVCQLAADYDTTPGITVVMQLQVPFDIVLEEP